MKRRLFAMFFFAGLLSGGFLVLEELDARGIPGGASERFVDKNTLQVRVNGRWENLPLMPIAQSACQLGEEHVQRYCD